MRKLRDRFCRWLAQKKSVQKHVQTRVDQAERDEWFESGIRVGIALVTKKPVHGMYGHYGEVIAKQASGAMEVIRLARTLEPASQTSGPMEALKSERVVNLARALPVQPQPQPAPATETTIKPPVMGVRQIAAMHVPTDRNLSAPVGKYFNDDSLQRMIDTRNLPAMTKSTSGVLFGMYLGKQKAEEKRKSG